MKILLIAGGWSPERDVSLTGARGIEKALLSLGHEVLPYDPEFSLDGLFAAASQTDFAFINLHGSPGEDGLIQAMLESIGCPYQGSGPAGSFLALNKAAAKQIFRDRGLSTADWVLLPKRPPAGWKPDFPFPVFIKSNIGGSSLNMEKVETPEDLEAALDRLFAQGGEYIVEPAITGTELTCGILGIPGGGEEALPPILIRSKDPGGVFDYANKYSDDGAEEICPAPLPEADLNAVGETALAAHRVLGLAGYSRADFILGNDGRLYLLEVNTLPGMTPNSLIPKAAKAVGLSYARMVERLIVLGVEAHLARCAGKPRQAKALVDTDGSVVPDILNNA